eukprot:m51a1_g13974 putative transmembrane protein c2orf18 homolog (428) ;mRNA; f:994182-995861
MSGGGLTLMSGLMELGMLFTGVVNTVLSKAQDNSRSRGWDGKEYQFSHPWTQCFFMFTAETLCLISFFIIRAVAPLVSQKAAKEQKPMSFLEKFPPILIVPAFCDLFGTSVSSIALLYVKASVWQMLRGSNIIFATIYARIFFKRTPPMFKILGSAVCICGLVLVGVSSVLTQSDGEGGSGSSAEGGESSVGAGKTILGIFLVILSQAITATQVTVEEALLKKKNLNPLHVCGMEGVYGLMMISFIVLPVVYFVPGDNPSTMRRGSYDSAIDAFVMMGNNIALLFFVICYIISDAIYNYFAQNVTKYLTAVHFTLIDACKSIFVWAWQIFTFYCINERFGEEWTKYCGIQIAGFVLVSLGTAIFNALFKVPGFDYSHADDDDLGPKKQSDTTETERETVPSDSAPEFNMNTKCDLELGELTVKKDGD